MFRKVLVANRGEIAVRVMRTLREMGIAPVAVYSDADRTSLHVRMADEAAWVGPAPASESYLRIDRIIDAARRHGADAIHPGYGFLSENPDFAEACEEAGIVFIGPSAESMKLMGSKVEARRTAQQAGVPVVPGSSDGVNGLDNARTVARQCGYPVMLKAIAGGGGKGMRRIDSEHGLESAFNLAAGEALNAFGDPRLYIEKVIERPRHIEIQVIGDRHGNLIHLGERECSLQRRHQKLIEECPSPLVSENPRLRDRMGEAAILAARAAGYYNAGTVEFLVDGDSHFHFLEMNTRLQVEHPVTELVTGLDLVKLQMLVAAGEPLPLRQEDVTWRGSAIEFRIYAEDPYNNFYPSPGTITRLTRPLGPGVRLDACVYDGWTVPIEYDPLLAKLAVWAGTRRETVARAIRAFREYDVAGIKTNIGFFRQILEDERFRDGDLHTSFIEEFLARRREAPPDPEMEMVAALVAAIHAMEQTANSESQTRPPDKRSRWLDAGRNDLLR
ncbi:MAG TPA: acetyl-CoA carboxylase biotin carboxylase subunit [Bryobacteraceae bacterium]|nr:acetyl-CoA carboxylase biotin carboxylase subunit [Bryobacteraceae bacterium]